MKLNRSLLCGYGKGRGLPITLPTIQFWRQIRNRLMSVSTMKGRGALIVFEGCDRCGKTTQCNLLLEKLTVDGTPVKLMKFPGKHRSRCLTFFQETFNMSPLGVSEHSKLKLNTGYNVLE